MELNDKKFAVLVDADNISHRKIKDILDEIANYGTPTIKRIYGDFTNPKFAAWKEVLLENSITPIQCNALLGLADNGLLAGDLAQVSDDSIDNLDVLFCLAGSHVDDDLIQLGNLHHALVAELLVQGRSDLIDILFFQTCHN